LGELESLLISFVIFNQLSSIMVKQEEVSIGTAVQIEIFTELACSHTEATGE
jgi:hypothetical protein